MPRAAPSGPPVLVLIFVKRRLQRIGKLTAPAGKLLRKLRGRLLQRTGLPDPLRQIVQLAQQIEPPAQKGKAGRCGRNAAPLPEQQRPPGPRLPHGRADQIARGRQLLQLQRGQAQQAIVTAFRKYSK